MLRSNSNIWESSEVSRSPRCTSSQENVQMYHNPPCRNITVISCSASNTNFPATIILANSSDRCSSYSDVSVGRHAHEPCLKSGQGKERGVK